MSSVFALLDVGLYNTPGWTPVFNLRGLQYLTVAAGTALAGWMLLRAKDSIAEAERLPASVWTVAFSVLVVWGVSAGLWESFVYGGIPDRASCALASVFALCFFWSVCGAALIMAGDWAGQNVLRELGMLLGVLAALVLALTWEQPRPLNWLPVANLQLLGFGGVAAMIGVGSARMRQGEERLRLGAWILSLFLLLWGVTAETYWTVCHFRWSFVDWRLAAQMFVSLVWTLLGVLMLIGGIARRWRPLRLMALGLLGLLGLTVVKAFLLDLGFLQNPYRVLSFGGLGLGLILISWLYTRYGVGKEGDVPPTGSAQPDSASPPEDEL